jgi:hypothetical protein
VDGVSLYTSAVGDPIGDLPESALPPAENGWSRRAVTYGDDVGGDEAVDLAYTAMYVKPWLDGTKLCIDLSYFVDSPTDDPENFGVCECAYFHVRDSNDDLVEIGVEDYIYDGKARVFSSIEEACAEARRLALADDREFLFWNGERVQPGVSW